jgi:hypothetical protein
MELRCKLREKGENDPRVSLDAEENEERVMDKEGELEMDDEKRYQEKVDEVAGPG